MTNSMKIKALLLTLIAVCTMGATQAIEPAIVWSGGLKYWILGDSAAVLLHKSAEVSIINSYIQTIYYPSDANYTDLPSRLIIPDSVVSGNKKYPVSQISDKAFAGTDLHEIKLPGTIKGMGSLCFMDCPNCTSVIVPEGNETVRVGNLFGGYDGTAGGAYYTANKKLQVPEQTRFYSKGLNSWYRICRFHICARWYCFSSRL